ncbi:MAG: Ig-like domain-containing protein [Candidatus Binatia bacterium]
MTIIATRPRLWTAAALTAAVLTACGGNGSSSPAPNTPTPTRTATLPPTAAATLTATASTGGIGGLVVLNHAVLASASDALGAPPTQWGAPADATSFDRSLAAANWSIDGSVHGITGADGRFTTGPLAPGAHTLQISKTLDGNLAALSIPFTVGDDGSTTLVVEVSWGQVRAIATFVQNGTPVEQIRGPSGSWLTLTGGLVSAFGDTNRSFTNPSSNGSFVCTLPDGSTCPPAEIQAVAITAGPTPLYVGQHGSLSAVAQLSDGTTIDVMTLASWQSSDDTVVTVDSWGTVSALAIGTASITATLGNLTSTPWPLAVTGLPALQKIDVENASCLYPLVNAGAEPPLVAATMPSARTDVLPVPNCTDVVQIGGTLQFRAIGEFADGYVQDITDQVQWPVTPADVGTVVTGLFTAVQAGTAQLTASLDGVASDPTQITVVTQPTVVAITIYAENSGIPVVSANAGGTGTAPAPVASGGPCVATPPGTAESVGPCCCPPPMRGGAAPCHCSYGLTMLVGDQLKFHATAQYDTGAWSDVTNQVIWQSSTPQAARIDASGVMTARQAGDTSITAALGSVASDPADVHVVDHATVQTCRSTLKARIWWSPRVRSSFSTPSPVTTSASRAR